MKMLNKSNKYIFILSLALIFTGISCSISDDENLLDTNNPKQLENIPEEYLAIGNSHNEALDYAFQSIRNNYSVATRNGQKVKFTKDALIEIGKQSVLEFSKEKGYFGYNEEFCRLILNNHSDKNLYATRSDSEAMPCSESLKRFVAQLDESISNVKYDDMDGLKYNIEAIVLEAQKTLSETELIALYAGVTTAYSSMEYWTKNFKKWQFALNNPELLAEFNDDELNNLKVKKGKIISPLKTRNWWDDAWSSVGESWDATSDYVEDWWENGGGKEVVGDDAGGAVAGAIGGAIAGAPAGGVGAVPGAIAGGIGTGASASIASAISWWISN